MKHVENKNKIADTNLTISILAFNETDKATSIKSQRLSDWIKNLIQLYDVYRRSTLNSKL